jgi:uncharacterized protein YjiS (DUF1127 family)
MAAALERLLLPLRTLMRLRPLNWPKGPGRRRRPSLHTLPDPLLRDIGLDPRHPGRDDPREAVWHWPP